jgi:hypothetical protein
MKTFIDLIQSRKGSGFIRGDSMKKTEIIGTIILFALIVLAFYSFMASLLLILLGDVTDITQAVVFACAGFVFAYLFKLLVDAMERGQL